MNRNAIAWVIVLFLLGAGVLHAAQNPAPSREDKEKVALAAARDWLKLIDAGEYRESWRESASIFRTAVTQDKWTQVMRSGREPFGALISRKMKVTTYMTELPGAPQGEYVMIQFETMFVNRKGIIVETVSPMLDTDNKWRVSGYFIK